MWASLNSLLTISVKMQGAAEKGVSLKFTAQLSASQLCSKLLLCVNYCYNPFSFLFVAVFVIQACSRWY